MRGRGHGGLEPSRTATRVPARRRAGARLALIVGGVARDARTATDSRASSTPPGLRRLRLCAAAVRHLDAVRARPQRRRIRVCQHRGLHYRLLRRPRLVSDRRLGHQPLRRDAGRGQHLSGHDPTTVGRGRVATLVAPGPFGACAGSRQRAAHSRRSRAPSTSTSSRPRRSPAARAYTLTWAITNRSGVAQRSARWSRHVRVRRRASRRSEHRLCRPDHRAQPERGGGGDARRRLSPGRP